MAVAFLSVNCVGSAIGQSWDPVGADESSGRDHGHGDWEGVKTYINVGCGIILAIGLMFLGAVIFARPYILGWFKPPVLTQAPSFQCFLCAALSVLALLFSTFNAAWATRSDGSYEL